MPTNEMMDRCHAGGEGEDVTRMPACYVYCQGDALYKSYETSHALTPSGSRQASKSPGPSCFYNG